MPGSLVGRYLPDLHSDTSVITSVIILTSVRNLINVSHNKMYFC